MTSTEHEVANHPAHPHPPEHVDGVVFLKAKREIERLEGVVSQQTKEIIEARSTIGEKEHVISALGMKIQHLEEVVEEKQKEVKQLDEQIGMLKEQEWLAQRASAKMESDVASSRVYAVKVNQLLDESVKTNEMIKKANNELESTRRRCNHYRIVIEAMEKELREAKSHNGEMKTLQDEVRTLKSMGIVKERENLQMKNALQMLETWFEDYDAMAQNDFAEVKRRAIEGVAYPEGVDGDKYDQFFRREKIKREEEAAAKKEKQRHVPGMHRKKTQDSDNDSEGGSGTKTSGSKVQPVQSYLDLGTIQADVNFNLIEHIRDLVSADDNFLLDHIRVGLRVQIKLERVVIPGVDLTDLTTGRHMTHSSSSQPAGIRSRSTPRRALTARAPDKTAGANGANGEMANSTSAQDLFPRLDRIVSQAVEDKTRRTVQTTTGQSGIVRYVGLLDMPRPNSAVFAGIKLDDKLGYTNGTFLGKRYFYAPEGHGVFIRLVDITAILNSKTYEYISLGRIFRKWKKMSNKKM